MDSQRVLNRKASGRRRRLIHVFDQAMPLSVAETGMPFATRHNLAEIVRCCGRLSFLISLKRLGIDREPRDPGRRAHLFIAQGHERVYAGRAPRGDVAGGQCHHQ
jgi:hypothetical protein